MMNDDPFNTTTHDNTKPTTPGDVLERANRIAHQELQHLHRALQVPSRFLNK